MKTSLDCLPCLLRQALEIPRLCGLTPAAHEALLREVLHAAAGYDWTLPPPLLARSLQRLLREKTGVADPYLEAKRRFNRLALELRPGLAERVARAADPFAMAVRAAIAGNVIDLGAKSGLTEAEVRSALDSALDQPLFGDLEALRHAALEAHRILYLTDNAGEIVLDRLLIERLPPGRVTVAVRGSPTLNDATLEDAREARLDALASLVDNGSDVPGTALAECAPGFQRLFREADLVIAKGQGNFETLCEVRAPLYCLFRVKCATVAEHCGYTTGSHVAWRAGTTNKKQTP